MRKWALPGIAALSLILPASAHSANQTLTVSRAGTGSGTVTSTPAGINCGTTCSANFDDGTSVTLTATAATNSTFTGWSGGNGTTNSDGTYTVSMTQARNVTATFALNTYALAVTKAGTGSGTLTSTPAGINCGTTCSANFDDGTSVTLTGTADANSRAVVWSGGN